MALLLVDLNEETRHFMVEEIDRDVTNKTLYLGKRLSETGQRDWPRLLKMAAHQYDDNWLGRQLSENQLINAFEERRTKSGISIVKVPVNANETLAEGEFNRFYARALCLRAIKEEVILLQIYRAKEVAIPRQESLSLMGSHIGPKVLLDDLRTHPGMDTALGLPPGPNSGLSVRIPRAV